jgi:phosphomannomutase
MIEHMNIVETTNVELSLAQDVDGDRLAIVDEQGNPIGEEYTLVLIENFILEKTKGVFVTNLSTTQLFDNVAEKIWL